MDPWLEHPALWPDFHNGLVAAVREWLGPVLRPRYYVAVERRTYLFKQDDLVLIGIPDVSVIPHRRTGGISPRGQRSAAVLDVEVPMPDELADVFLEIHESSTREVVTILELLSPANKLHGKGRRDYERKREDVFGSLTGFVEIDLLRAGEPMPLVGQPVPSCDYRILVSPGSERPRAQLHRFNVRDPIPSFGLPLLPGDREPEVDLNSILHGFYERAGFDLRLDYAQPPLPPLDKEDAEWAGERLRGR
jgi:hypothetical protein